jgi:IS30 family transposase
MPGVPLSLRERDEISRMLIENPKVPWARIGREIERPATTVMREVTLRGGRAGYRPGSADRDAKAARRRPRECMSGFSDTVRERIANELGQGRSPYAIWRVLNAEDVATRPCVETIYLAVYTGALGVQATECLRTRRSRRRPRQARHSSKRAGLSNIGSRSDAVDDRRGVGHWEADLIIGARNRSALLTLCERVTRFAMGITMLRGLRLGCGARRIVRSPRPDPRSHAQVGHLRPGIRVGREWETLAATFNISTWFCDPHTPWQRGQIENLQPNLALLVPTRYTPRQPRPGPRRPRRRHHQQPTPRNLNLNHQRPTDLHAAATVQ